MARSAKEARLELERLQAMHRSMPNHKDDAAQQLASKIAAVQREIDRAESGGPAPQKRSGISLGVLVGVAVLLGCLAFAAAYFGGRSLS